MSQPNKNPPDSPCSQNDFDGWHQLTILLDEKTFELFEETLERPLHDQMRLQGLLATKSPWEEEGI